jgi:cold shock CspA family protein
MGKSQETWNKKENEKKRLKKKKDKEARKEERKANAKEGNSFEIAYVDEYGNFSSTPPDPKNKVKINEADIQISVPKHAAPSQADLIRKGIVTFFNDSKGYGFIKDMETQESVFVHVNGLTEPIKENNKVTFEVEMGQKGPNAVRVKLVH